MGRVIDLLGRSVGTIEEVIKHNTLIPLASRFIRPEDTESIVSHFIEGPRGGLASKVGMAGQASGWAKHRLLRCIKCLKEDIGSCGRPFWRRDHLLPGILFCGKHQMPLHIPCETCLNYSRFRDRTLHAGHHCGCGLKPVPEALQLTAEQSEVEIELARVTSLLLDPSYMPTLDFQRVAKETSNAASEIGLLEGGILRHAISREYLSDSPFSSPLRRTGFLDFSQFAFGEVIRGDTTLRHPIPAIAMLIALAGSWKKMEERSNAPSDAEAKAAKANNVQQVIAPAFVLERSADRIAEDIARYTELRVSRPELNHSQLRRRFGNAAQRYLTVERLLAAGVDVATTSNRTKDASDARIVEELIAHIEQRSLHLRATQYPHRITTFSLMSTFRRPNLFHQAAMLKRLIRAYETLQQHVENTAAWRERIAATGITTIAKPRGKKR